MSPYRTIIEWITPPETRPIVSELLAQAQQVRDLRGQIERVRNDLDSSWTGGAKNSFISNLDSLIHDYGNFANNLETKAGEIAAITVWVEVQQWFEDIINPTH